MPFASQSPEGGVEIALGAKGVVEVELVARREKWGRGAKDDIHSSYKAELDSAVWRMVKALSTLVSEDGNDPAIDGWFEHVKPLTARQKEIIARKGRAHQRSRREEAARRAALGAGSVLRGRPGAARLAADGEHRRDVCRLYRPRRQDGPAVEGHRQARFPIGARSDGRGGRGEAEGASGQARLRRHRGQGDRRLRPDPDRRELGADQGVEGGLRGGRHDRSVCRRVSPVLGRATCSPVRRSACRPGISAPVTAAGRTRRTNITSSSRAIQRCTEWRRRPYRT